MTKEIICPECKEEVEELIEEESFVCSDCINKEMLRKQKGVKKDNSREKAFNKFIYGE